MPTTSSADIGWKDGQPRKIENIGNLRFEEGQGEKPIRPRSVSAPQPANTVDYQKVRRNAVDAVDLADHDTITELVVKNTEAIRQFEYLQKSLATFQDKAATQAKSLRQPVPTVGDRLATDGINVEQDIQDEAIAIATTGKSGASSVHVGAAPVYIDVNFGNSSAMVPLSVLYTEGDNSEFDDQHLKHLQPVLVEGEGYLYGIKSVQKVSIKESIRGHDFVSVHSGPHHSLAITAGGQVVSWGANDMRQLGYQGAEDGVLGLEMVPQHVKGKLDGEIVVSAACGAQHSVVITEDGKVFTWGAYLSGQLGLGEISKEMYPYGYKDVPEQIEAIDTRAPRAVACGDYHTVLIDGLGDLMTFGTVDKNANGQNGKYDEPSPKMLDIPKEIVGLDFRQVSCGSYHTIALTAQGELWAWGWNEFGQLGLGDSITRAQPNKLSEFLARNIRKIACGETHSVCLSDRDVYTFGNGAQGALGHGNAKAQHAPKKVLKITEQIRIRDVEAGPQYTVAISDLGQMYFTGNMKSTSGRGAKHVYNVPMRFKGLEAIYGVACGWHEVTALVRIPVPPPLDHTFKAGIFQDDNRANLVDGFISRACTWGKASGGKLGHGLGKMSQTDLKTPFAIYGELFEFSVTVVCCGETFSLCITDNGRLFSWGENKEGQLGVGDFKGRAHPTLLEKFCDPDQPRLKDMKNKIFENISVGNWHCLAITNKKKVYAWGKNKYGQLGLGHTKNQEVPHCVLPLCDPLSPKHVRSIAAGKSHSVAAGEDGDVFSWGRGWDGQLGHKLISEVVYEPRVVEDMENKSTAILACGREHTVAVSTNGNMWVWGDNKAGQLGIGSIIQSNQPVSVALLDEHEVKLAACGREHTVCVTATNEVYGFGSSIYDQLGLGHLGIFPRPQRIPGLTAIPSIRQLACGFYSTAVIGGDDNAYLLGRWDGLTVGSFVGSIASKYTNVKRSGKINAEKLSLPLGIQSVRSLSLGKSHGIIIGIEEDKQNLIQQRIEREAQAELSAKQTFVGAANAGKSSAGNKSKINTEREPVQPWVNYKHGGEPFPSEILEVKENQVPAIKTSAQGFVRDERDPGDTDSIAPSQFEDGLPIDDDSRSVASKGKSETGGSNYTSSQTEARKANASEPRELAANHKGHIIAWGNNQYYQLGCTADLGSTADPNEKSKKPLTVASSQVGCPPTILKFDIPSVTTVSCGEYHTIAVCQDGSLWTWGRNNMGQLGHGDCFEVKRKLPTQVMGLAKKICIRAAAGGQHSLVLTSSNKVYSWGCNIHGQLGLSKKVKNVPSPDIVTALRRSGTCHIACGYSHSVALLSSEQIFTWGRNDCGQLGLGHYGFVDIPEHVTFFSKFQVQQVSCGYDHCIAFVKETESQSNSEVLRELVFSWGRGEEGQLGHSDPFSRCVPKEIATLTARGILMVTAGGFSSVAIDEADQVYTWGDCGRGQLGHGDKVRRAAPAIVMQPLLENQPKPDVRGTFRARAVVAGPNFMLGIVHNSETEHDEKWSWGDNSHGQLAMPYCNMKKRKAESHKMKLAPEKIPFLTKYRFKEISCGLEHALAVVDLHIEKYLVGQKKRADDSADFVPNLDHLERDLEKLYVGEVEESEFSNSKTPAAGDEKDARTKEIVEEGEGNEDAEDDDEDEEKLNYPRQIYDKIHSVKPIIKRIGLSEDIAHVFEEHKIKLDSFVTLKEEDLQVMGINKLGARRRILSTIDLLKNAKQVEEEEADTFVPDEYTREQVDAVHPNNDQTNYLQEEDKNDDSTMENGQMGWMPGVSGLPIIWPPGGWQ